MWGFIAQEVRDTLPYATQLRKEVIPNINEVGAVSSNVITFTNFNTSNLEANAYTIEVYSKQDEAKKVTITEVIDDHRIRVEEDLTEWMTETTTQTISVEEYEALENQDGFTALEDDTDTSKQPLLIQMMSCLSTGRRLMTSCILRRMLYSR